MLSRLHTLWRAFVRANIIADDPYEAFSDSDFAYLSKVWRDLHPRQDVSRNVADRAGGSSFHGALNK